jgi:hypothetical protein
MARHSYRLALRAKGIKPIPPARKLRSSLTVAGDTIDATASAMKESQLQRAEAASGMTREQAMAPNAILADLQWKEVSK